MMKNNFLFILSILAVTMLSFCANSDDDFDYNCLDDDLVIETCGLVPIPSAEGEVLDFCDYVQTLVDEAEPDAKDNIIVSDRGVKPLIAAPHGGSDLGTEDIVDKVGENLGVNSLSFFRFRSQLNVNVNRPTEQAMNADSEEWAYDAASVYHCYRESVLNLIQANANSFYFEVHGNARMDSNQKLEIVTSEDVTSEQDSLIKIIFEEEIIKVYGSNATLHAYTLGQDPNEIYFKASTTRSCGLFCSLQDENIPAIHLEIPSFYRGATAGSQERAKIVSLLTNVMSRIDSDIF